MKKIVNHPKDLRLDGVVESDGVGFLPEREVGPILFQTSGYFATTDDDGMIVSRVLSLNIREEKDEECHGARMEAKIKAHSKLVVMAAIIAIVASLVMMFVSVSWDNADIWIDVFMSLLYLMLGVLLLPKAWTILGGRIFHNKEILNFSRYLGAKNAVENAYYDLGRAPNIEEVKDYSTYSAECKYTKNGYFASLVWVISCVHFLDGVWYWIAVILVTVLMVTLEVKNKLVFWQALVVATPSEEHYKVAIRAMEETAELIDGLHVSYHEVEARPDPENFNEEKCKICPEYDFCKKASQELQIGNEEKNSE